MKDLRYTGDGTWDTLALSCLFQSTQVNMTTALTRPQLFNDLCKVSYLLAKLLVDIWQNYHCTLSFYFKVTG